MKRMLSKIGAIAVLVLGVISFKYNASNIFPGHRKSSVIEDLNISNKSRKNFSHYLALKTKENFKAYHYGLLKLVPLYRPPAFSDIINEIHRHANFFKLNELKRGFVSLRSNSKPFAILERSFKNSPPFFCFISKRGIHTFSLNTLQLGEVKLISLDNGTRWFRNLSSFLSAKAYL